MSSDRRSDRSTRLRPVRAGIVNLWDYTDHEFAFHGGRLVLRGPNGSGKTKALELLFPFLLDASIAPQRLDPFSGTGRTMRDNLLYRPGRDTVTGYAWMEFADDVGACWVIGAGMRGQRARNDVKSWFFVTDRSYGDGWSVLDAERQPLSESGLGTVLGPANVFQSAREYRSRVDAVLFGGIGPDRYAALMQLVLFLRRPQLAKDLDLRQLSETLSAGLRPVDDELLAEGATSFEDLEAVQHELERLERTCVATDAFLRSYRPYVRVVARHRVDLAQSAMRALRSAENLIAVSSERADMAAAACGEADRLRRDAEAQRKRLESEREVQLRSSAYQAIAQLDDLRRFADFARIAATESVEDADRATARFAEATKNATAARTRADEASVAAGRAFEALRAAGLSVMPARMAEIDGLQGVADPLSGGLSIARERRLDHGAVDELMSKAERAAERADLAEHELAAAASLLDQNERSLKLAETAVIDGRAEVVASITGWAALWPWIDVELVGDLHVQASEGDPPILIEIALSWTAPKRERISAAVALLEVRVRDVEATVELLERDLLSVEAEREDGPIAPIVARRDRAGLDGAPLWRLVDFAPGMSDNEQAGLEAALLGSGVLDAWVTRDGADEGPIGGEGSTSFDAMLVPSERFDGPSLSTLLIPDASESTGVSARRIAAILDSIGVSTIRPVFNAVDAGRMAAVAGVAVDVTGRFAFGPLHGRTGQSRAGHIGATARRHRRERRVEELRAQITGAKENLVQIHTARVALAQELDDIAAAIRTLPPVTPVVDALKLVGTATSSVLIRRADRRRREETSTEAAALRGAAQRALIDEARKRSVPTDRSGLDRFRGSLDGFESAVREVGARSAEMRRADERTAVSDASLVERASDEERLSAAMEQRQMESRNRAAELATLLDTVGADAKQVEETLQMLDADLVDIARTISDRQRQWEQGFQAQTEAEAARNQAVIDRDRARSSAHAALQRLAVLRRPELRAVLDIADTDDLERFLPVLAAACREAVATDEQRQARKTGVRNAFQTLESSLGARYVASLDDADDIDVVMIADDDGRVSSAAFADRITLRRDDQRTLLSAQERQVLEDTLIDSLCRQLHLRLRDGEDQVKRMNRTLVGRRTTSGTGVQLSWSANDNITDDQKQVVKLLERSPAFMSAEDRGLLREALAHEIKATRANDAKSGYYDVLSRVLDYRSWRTFGIRLQEYDGSSSVLTKKVFNTRSGGEKATILHLPLFAAAAAHFDSAAPHAPRMIALDEAFAGIDAPTTRALLGLTVEFDLDVFLTGHDFWGAVPEVPEMSIVTLSHHRDSHTVGALNSRWDGHVLNHES